MILHNIQFKMSGRLLGMITQPTRVCWWLSLFNDLSVVLGKKSCFKLQLSCKYFCQNGSWHSKQGYVIQHMSQLVKLYQKQQIDEAACLWISKIERGLSSMEKEELTRWMIESEARSVTMLKKADAWDNPNVLTDLCSLYPLTKPRRSAVSTFRRIAMAASVLFISLIGTNLLLSSPWAQYRGELTQHQAQTFETSVGQQNRFTLSDGSSISLNTNSRVTINYTPSHRQLTLHQGEVNFEVAKDKARPFTVNVGKQAFTALGTVFNVQKDTDQAMELLVTEGRVLVSSPQYSLLELTQSLTALGSDELSGTVVSAGEKATIKHKIIPVTKIEYEDIERELAWQQGMLVFNAEPLGVALREVSRYTNASFKFSSPELAQLKVSGYFKAGDVDGLLLSLNSNFNLAASRNDNNTITLTPTLN